MKIHIWKKVNNYGINPKYIYKCILCKNHYISWKPLFRITISLR